MARFSLKYPYFIIVCCLISCVVGIAGLVRMPVDLFPQIKIPVVVVATFYNGMPAQEVETSITGRFERFFTLGSGIEHIESKSLPGVSLIKVFFQPGTDADSAVTTISNLAMADLRKLPKGTLPPVVLKFDASSLPVCLITLKAEGLNETQLRDLGQYAVRNQVASVPGASAPQPFGGRYRQIMVYVDPLKLEAHQLSVMDVVRSVNDSNLILPAGDVRVGPYDDALFTNSQIDNVPDINGVPLKTVGKSPVTVGDVGAAEDASQIQNNIVRVDGQPSVYLPVLKQGRDSNTIAIVNGVKNVIDNLVDVPKQLVTKVVFDQSLFVKKAIANLVEAAGMGMVLTGVMILLFLASLRATVGVFLSIPLSVLVTFAILSLGDNSIDSMILGGFALAFTRLINNSVVVLENIYRHLELGETPAVAAETGGKEVALPVLAGTITTAIVFFPVIMLYGVSRYLFSALALSVVLALFASYVVAMTVVPLFCAKYLSRRQRGGQDGAAVGFGQRFNAWFLAKYEAAVQRYQLLVGGIIERPMATLLVLGVLFAGSLTLAPFLGYAYFPRTDPGQFLINIKAPTGTRLESTTAEIAKVEDIIRHVVTPQDLDIVVSNIGVTPGFSSMYTSNTGTHTAFVQVSLKDGHKIGSYQYMDRVRAAVQSELPELTTYFQSGGLVDAVLNLGLPAPIDIQISGSNLQDAYKATRDIAAKISQLPNVSDVFIPQDIDAPGLEVDVNRLHAAEMGLTQKEVISDVITALTSNQMIAPSYWVDPKSGNDYMLTVQYPEGNTQSLEDLKAIPIKGNGAAKTTRLDTVVDIKPIEVPTMVSHYQLRRVIDIYVAPKKEDLSATTAAIDKILAAAVLPDGTRTAVYGSVTAMDQSFKSFGEGFALAVVLVYLVLVAQFRSFKDPFIIVLAVPPGIVGVVLTLVATPTTLNIMSLMGVVMLAGISVSNSILIVEYIQRLRDDGMSLREAVITGSAVRLRPVIMTSLATIMGLLPLAVATGAGSEAYAPLARVIIGGLAVSVIATIFCVPAAYYLAYRRQMLAAGQPAIAT